MFEMADHPSRSHLRGRPRVVSWERASNVSNHSAWWLGIVFFSPLVQCGLCWLFFPFHDPWGLSWGSSHVSTPQRWNLEPRGWRSLPPSLGRPRVPTGSPTPRHSRLGEQLSQSLAAAGQVGGGQAEVFGVQRGGLPGTVERKAFPMWRGRDGWVFFALIFTGAIWECELMPRLMYGQILIWVWWGSISRLSVGQHCCWWIYCEIIGLTTKDTGQASQKALTIWLS